MATAKTTHTYFFLYQELAERIKTSCQEFRPVEFDIGKLNFLEIMARD